MGSVAAWSAVLGLLLLWQADPYAAARESMVRQQIEQRGVKDPQVLKALREVPRHEFVPREHRDGAYGDRPLPIGQGQTISQPYIVALMTELLEPDPELTVLEIGTGSGYQAAVLSKVFRRVYSIELLPELAERARATLRRLGYDNVLVRAGDGYLGWPEAAPFDRIILTAAPPELPRALTDQLKPGGILVAPVGESTQELVVVEKTARGELRRRTVLPVRFVPMVRDEGQAAVSEPEPAKPQSAIVWREAAVSRRLALSGGSAAPETLATLDWFDPPPFSPMGR